MVKIESMSDEEKDRENKRRTLIELTEMMLEEEFKGEEIIGIDPFIHIVPPEKISDISEQIIIDPSKNMISVYSQKRLDTAMKLAKGYERWTEEGFTIKKEYEE